MKNSLLVLCCAAILASCSLVSTRKMMRPSDLLIPEGFSVDPPQKLRQQDIRHDVSLAIYALERAYGGRRFVPQEQLVAAVAGLEKLLNEEGLSPKELCEKIGVAIGKVKDMHLHARLGSEACAAASKQERKPNVGKNVYGKYDPPWAIQYENISTRKVPIVSIVAFPQQQDASWKGFLDSIRRLKKSSPAIIVDLRGNGGGDDTMGSLMAEILYGQEFPSPVLSQIKSKTPETMAIRLNNPIARINKLKKSGKEVPDYWYSKQRTAMREYEDALQGKTAEEVEQLIESGPAFDPTKGFNKPIVLLVDAACASSCESTVDFFENHPNAVTVGENTGGFIHFGNMGFVVLPRSKILIQMATDYWKYKDGRFIEGVGIAPRISVQPGEDALERAKALLTAKWKK